jgi:two-component system, LytTR family, sensor kinase
MNEQIWLNFQKAWKHRWVRVLLYTSLWSSFAVFYAVQLYYIYGNRDDVFALTWEKALTREFSYWSIWALLTPVIIRLVRAYRIGPNNWKRAIGVHLFAAAFFSIAHLIMYIILLWVVDPAILVANIPSDRLSLFGRLVKSIAIMNFNTRYLIYWVILFFSHAIYYYKQFQESELRRSQLQTKLVQAQLESLKMQLHPHFLFNTLDAISSLMYSDADTADRMITRLSDLLRMTLDKSSVHEVRLKEELDMLQKYLDIEQMRFRNRLQVEYSIAAEVLDAHVPNLILQPLVENAISHGIAHLVEGGKITIKAYHEDGYLAMEVTDNGRGLSVNQRRNFKQGIGLANTRARLQQLYDGDYSFKIVDTQDRGFSAVMKIPFLTHSDVTTR